jgi:UDP-N-acetylmuramoyl-L-alanyl-D-glutamate--2,6-diaminopimelate ligase
VSESAHAHTTLSERGVSVRTLVADSRMVQPGDVFLAYPGGHVDGRDYISDACARGAAAVVADDSAQVGAGETAITTPLLRVENLAALCGELAAHALDQPSQKLWVAGITGTNGKTSCSQWLAQALTLLGERCGVIGTLGNGLYGQLTASPNTTPDALILQAELAGLVAAGASACAIEVSSIGIEEQRINGMRFDVAIFTNLTQDHLDYHGTMAAYAAAKARLFAWPDLGAAVINLDDAFGRELMATLPAHVRAIGYTLDPEQTCERAGAQLLCPSAVNQAGQGVRFEINGVRFVMNVVGRFNVANALAVIAALQLRGISLERCAEVLAQIAPPPGRMQALGNVNQPLVVVDFAHTPDALEKTLTALRETARDRAGRLYCVFGCGGDRDPGKRPLMGAIAERLADSVIVTSDNPRSEDPQSIILSILAGMSQGAAHEIDRRRAIANVIRGADASDVILIAGKGHEPYQEIAGVKHPYSDSDEVQAALERW